MKKAALRRPGDRGGECAKRARRRHCAGSCAPLGSREMVEPPPERRRDMRAAMNDRVAPVCMLLLALGGCASGPEAVPEALPPGEARLHVTRGSDVLLY